MAYNQYYSAGSISHDRPDTYISGIDGLRAISVISVLIYHLNSIYLPGGFIGVDVFFVISGYVVTKSMLDYSSIPFSNFIRKFYRRRLTRIIPALVFFLIVTALFSTIFIPTTRAFNSNDLIGFSAFFGLSNFTLWFFSDNYFSPATEFNPFTHTWSLAVEEQFYLIFPLMIFFTIFSQKFSGIYNNGFRILFAFMFGSLLICVFFTIHDQTLAFYMLPMRFWELGAGALLFLALNSSGGQFRNLISGAPPVVVAGISALATVTLALSLVLADASRFPFPWALAPVLASMAILLVVTLWPRGVMGRTLSTPVLVFFGKISYALYLWHFGVIVLFRWTIGLEALWQQIAAAALGVGLATLSYRLVEAPVRYSPSLAAKSDGYVISRILAAVLLASLLSGAIFAARPYISLSRTVDDSVWSPNGRPSLVYEGCEAVQSRASAFGGDLTRFIPQNCGAEGRLRRMIVIGDSHAGAYAAMMQHVAASERMQIDIYRLPGCQPFRFRETSGEGGGCRDVRDALMKEAAAALSEGDVLFLAGLRVPRFRDQSGARIRENAELDLAPTEGDLDEASASLDILGPALASGVRVIVEAPKPVFRAAPVRCADWFTRSNPYCAAGFETAREEMEQRRSRILISMQAFADMDPGVAIWDPLPLLCGAEVCPAFLDGEPLFTDGDHLSRYGNMLLLPHFTEYLRSVL